MDQDAGWRVQELPLAERLWAFSVAQSQVEVVKRYIQNQKQHHRRVTFQDEYRNFLRRYEIDFDERYVWD